jgi:stage V sporulation protein B
MLAPLIPVMYLDTAIDSLLKGMGEQLYCMKVNIADASLSVIFVYFLVPIFGVTGYAATIIIAEVINTALSITRLIRIIRPRLDLRMWLIKPFVCSLLACAAMRFIINRVPRFYGHTDGLSTALFMIAGSALYLALLAATDTVFHSRERHTADTKDADVKHTKVQVRSAKNSSIKQHIN